MVNVGLKKAEREGDLDKICLLILQDLEIGYRNRRLAFSGKVKRQHLEKFLSFRTIDPKLNAVIKDIQTKGWDPKRTLTDLLKKRLLPVKLRKFVERVLENPNCYSRLKGEMVEVKDDKKEQEENTPFKAKPVLTIKPSSPIRPEWGS